MGGNSHALSHMKNQSWQGGGTALHGQQVETKEDHNQKSPPEQQSLEEFCFSSQIDIGSNSNTDHYPL